MFNTPIVRHYPRAESLDSAIGSYFSNIPDRANKKNAFRNNCDAGDTRGTAKAIKTACSIFVLVCAIVVSVYSVFAYDSSWGMPRPLDAAGTVEAHSATDPTISNDLLPGHQSASLHSKMDQYRLERVAEIARHS